MEILKLIKYIIPILQIQIQKINKLPVKIIFNKIKCLKMINFIYKI
jgi:hypothetical protein